MELRKVKRNKLVVGEPYCDTVGAEFVYLGKFDYKTEKEKCLFFYPMNELANNYFKEKDNTVAFIDSHSFFIHEEI